MTQNKKIAVTGGIGSGKSAFCNILRQKGYPVFSCDEIYKDLLKDGDYLVKLRALFPQCFFNGILDKKALSSLIFTDAPARARLEALAHPLIMEELRRRMERETLSFAEVPLLFEGGYEGEFDAVIALRRPKNLRLQAVISRDGITEEQVIERMKTQFDDKMLEGKNCVIIENDGQLVDLRRKTEEILKILCV